VGTELRGPRGADTVQVLAAHPLPPVVTGARPDGPAPADTELLPRTAPSHPPGATATQLRPTPPPATSRPGPAPADLWSTWGGSGAAGPPEEPVGPFGPPVPTSRPPRDQTRLVIVVLVALLVVGTWWAGRTVFDFRGTPLVAGTTPGVTTPSATTPAPTRTPTPTVSTRGRPRTPPPEIAGVQALDPEGDGGENSSSAPRAIDSEPGTAWRSERYNSPEFGGIKSGVGLLVALEGSPVVTSVLLDAPGSDGTVELRTAEGPGLDDSTVVATAPVDGGRVTLTPAKPVTTRYLVLWFTRLPRAAESGDRRVFVNEIDVR
jgi:hypothetical protein